MYMYAWMLPTACFQVYSNISACEDCGVHAFLTPELISYTCTPNLALNSIGSSKINYTVPIWLGTWFKLGYRTKQLGY